MNEFICASIPLAHPDYTGKEVSEAALFFSGVLLASVIIVTVSAWLRFRKSTVRKMKSKYEILDEMVAYFFTNSRAMEGGMGEYLTEDGRRCGHSIFVREDMMGVIDIRSSATTNIEIHGDCVHKPDYQGHQEEFWQDVQDLHDDDDFWYSIGESGHKLTRDGISHVKMLKQKWS